MQWYKMTHCVQRTMPVFPRYQITIRILGPSSMKLLARVFHTENAHTRAFRRGAMGRPREPLLGELCKVAHELMPDLLQPTVHDGAPEVTVPTLLIWGERDRMLVVDAGGVATSFDRPAVMTLIGSVTF